MVLYAKLCKLLPGSRFQVCWDYGLLIHADERPSQQVWLHEQSCCSITGGSQRWACRQALRDTGEP